MADILIKGLALPKKGALYLTILNDGHVVYSTLSGNDELTTAIELPEHGRLGDLDLVEEWMRKKHKEHDCPFNIDAFLSALRKIPTIVEASNADN